MRSLKVYVLMALISLSVACGDNNDPNDGDNQNNVQIKKDMPDINPDMGEDMPVEDMSMDGCPADLSREPDLDRDGLKDCEEKKLGTDPNKADTDGDGLDDYDEIDKHKTDPLKPDTDGDGLSDGLEVDTHKTDPLKADTDGDGLEDGDEIGTHKTDPLKPDTDGDGLNDRQEVEDTNSNPLKVDTDDDGLEDGDEVSNGADPNKPDTDGDGLLDVDEVNVHMTNPALSDTDGDGLSDPDELSMHMTSPILADTDGDGLNDGDELTTHMTNPTAKDSDFDGLSDGEEINTHMTNPLDVDTDGDGLLDFFEVTQHMSDPNKVDTDGDGLEDGDEVNIHASDPNKVDTDGDTLTDLQEVELGLDPSKIDSLGDGTNDAMRWFVQVCLNSAQAPVNTQTISDMANDWSWTIPNGPTLTQHDLVVDQNTYTMHSSDVVVDTTGLATSFLIELPRSTSLIDDVKSKLAIGSRRFSKAPTPYTSHDGFPAVHARVKVTVNAVNTTAFRNLLVDQFLGTTNAMATPALSTSMDTAATNYVVEISAVERANTIIFLTTIIKENDYYTKAGAVELLKTMSSSTTLSKHQASTQTACNAFEPQTSGPDVYLYMVGDQSGSMNTYFQSIKTNLPSLFADFSTVMASTKLGVTNMSANFEGKLRPNVGWHSDQVIFGQELDDYVVDCPDPCSGFEEHGLYATYKGLEYMKSGMAPANQAVPMDQRVGVLYVTDETDQSIKDSKDPMGMNDPMLLDKYVTRLTTLNAKTFGILGGANGCGFEVPEAYYRIVSETTGDFVNLCSTPTTWKSRFGQYYKDLVGESHIAYTLRSKPMVSSIRIFVNNQEVSRDRVNGFDYFPYSNTITFFGTSRPVLKDVAAGVAGDRVVVIYEKR